jgi:hypothetical protein
MIVLVTETTMTVAKALANNISSSVLAPSLWVSTRHYFCILPAHFFHHFIKESRPLILSSTATVTIATPVTLRRRRGGRRAHSLSAFSFLLLPPHSQRICNKIQALGDFILQKIFTQNSFLIFF